MEAKMRYLVGVSALAGEVEGRRGGGALSAKVLKLLYNIKVSWTERNGPLGFYKISGLFSSVRQTCYPSTNSRH